MAVNKVILVGNVGKDPETRYLDENTPVCKFPLATSETYKNRNGERVEQTEWHNIVLWRGLAQVAENYVRKGSQLFIEGRIKTRSYDDKDGVKRYITEIVGDNMQMLGRKGDSDSGGGDAYRSGESASTDSGGAAAGTASGPDAQTGGSAGTSSTSPSSADTYRTPPEKDPGQDIGPASADEADDLPF